MGVAGAEKASAVAVVAVEAEPEVVVGATDVGVVVGAVVPVLVVVSLGFAVCGYGTV